MPTSLTSQAQSVLTWLQSQSVNGELSPTQLAQFTSELQIRLNGLSVQVPGGSNSVTLLYSGQLGDGGDVINAYKVAERIGTQSGGSVTTIGNTEVGSLMNDRDFGLALTEAVGTVNANNILNGYTDASGKSVLGLWSTTSERLVQSASGDVRTLTPFAAGDKVFAQTELPSLLENPTVTSINGVPKAIYQQVYDSALASGGTTAAETALLNAVNYSSATLTNNLSVAVDTNGNVSAVASGNLLEGTGLGNLSIPSGNSNSVTSLASDYQASLENSSLATTAIKQGGIALGEAEMTLLSQGNTVARLGMASLGVGGGVLAGAVTIYTVSQINDALNNGDTATANSLARQLVSSWTGGLAGATAAGSLTGELLSPLLAAGPVGGAIYVTLVGAASLAGGYWGNEAVNSLFGNLNFDPLGSSSTTTIDTVNFTQITKFANGSVLTQPIDEYTDAAGIPHIGIYASGDARATTLQVPDASGGYTVISTASTGTTLTQWSGQPGSSTQIRQIQTTPQTTDPISGKIQPATVNVYQGNSAQSVSTTIINADGSKVQTDYTDSTDPNIKTITTFSAPGIDSTGNLISATVTSTSTITQAIDTTTGSPTYGQPVADTYNIVNKDGTGAITATGQRVVDPTDGSYQDTLIGSATTANPQGTVTVTRTDSQGNTTPVVSQTGILTLNNQVSAFNDAYSLIQAIQKGQTLPAVGSGLRLANDLNGGSVPALSMAGNAIGVVTGIQALNNALKTGDTAAGVVAGTNTFVNGVNLYTTVAYDGDAINAAADGLGDLVGTSNAASQALPYLNVANDLAHGNYAGAIGDSIGIYVATTLTAATVGAEIGAAAGPIGVLVGTVIGSVVGDLFGSSPPPPWGTATAGWGGSGSYKINAVGDSGGDHAAYNVLSTLVNGLQNIATQYNNLGQPGLQLGIIPERLGGISFSSNQFHVNTVDPATGQAINPGLNYDTNGNVSSSSTYEGNAAYFQTLGAYYTSNALARQAIAPEWEVQTAQMQAAAGLSNAGLTETQRAANLGELASALPANATTETWNPIGLDFGGGLATTSLSGSTVQFNVDGTDNLDANLTGAKDTQYLHQTAWLNKTDGFLVLDENMNGSIDNGEEMFSDSQVGAAYRGVASMAAYDANGDGVINASDPVFAQLGVWIDAQGTGQMTSTNYHSLASLGISSLNYRLGTYTRSDGSVHAMGTLNLQASTTGTSYTAVASGVELTSTNGQVTLEVTRLTNLSSVQANEVSVDNVPEDGTVSIPVRGNSNTGGSIQGLLDNDSVSNAPNAVLQLQSVQNAQGGTVSYNAQSGMVTFTPTTGFYGTAGFDYTINAGAYGTATAHVQVHVVQVDHPPVITGNALQQIPIYGYVASSDDDGGISYTPSYTPGWGYADANGGGGYSNRTTPISYQTNPDAGTLSVTDQDYPASALTWSIANQAQHGTASVDAHGDWTFSGGQALGGNDAFVVQVTDPLGGKAQYTVTVPLPQPSGGGDGDGDGGDDGSGTGDGDGDGGDGGGDGGGDPLVLDLKGSGFQFTSLNNSNVFFQQSGDGLRHQTAWFTGGDGVLAYDKYGNGIVQDSSQIDFYKQVSGATDDLQALQILANGASQLNASSPVWSKLGVWVDANNDGVCEQGEFKTLTQLGITAINFTDTPAFSVQNGVVIHEMATFTYANGTTRNMAEVTLPFSNAVLASNGQGSTQIEQLAKASLANPITVGDGNNLVLGNAGDNAVSAGNGNNVVITGAGNDLIEVGNGSNSIQSGDGNDLVVAGNGNNTILLGSGAKTVVVGAGNNMVVGGSGNNIIMAGEGNNVLYAGSGNSVVFAQDGANTLVGGAGYNELIAGNGNNTFTDGGGRADMSAGTGSNTFTVTNAQDTITVAAPTAGQAAGGNTVKTSVNWTLGANQQILWGVGSSALVLTGNNAGDQIIGNGVADTLIGGSGNDTLADSGGAATLVGGGGNDVFVVSNAATVVQQVANSGTSTIKTSVNYTLVANVQTLVGTGNAALTLTGGSQNGVTVQANNANDTLMAGSGIATLIGGSGNDTFVVNNTQDVVQAQASGGVNTIQSSVSFTASAHVQNLIGTGNANLTLTGNGQNDTVQANAGNDTLVAGNGSDTLVGGAGNDTYQLGNSAELVKLGSGQSTVRGGNGNASVQGNASGAATIALGDGANQIDLSANNQANTITLGNGANTVLVGQGNNTITVGNGNDQITTGSGVNALQVGTGNDTIVNHGGTDNLTFAPGVSADKLTFAQSGSDLLITEAFTGGSVRVVGGYNNATSGMAQFNLGNGAYQVQLDNANYKLTAGNGNNTITGGQGKEAITLGSGSNTVTLGNGADTVSAQDAVGASDSITLGQGSDTVILANGNDKVSSADLAGTVDTLTLGNGNSTVNVGQGNDKITVGNGANTITGGNGANAVVLGSGNNSVTLGSGNNKISAADMASAKDTVIVGNGSNNIALSQGNDSITAGNGANTITGGNGANTVALGSGNNSVTLSNGNNKISTADMAGAKDMLVVGNGNNSIVLGQGNDSISAGSGSNTVTGGNGADTLTLGSGSNTVMLGNGTDTVSAQDLAGAIDTVNLGNGNDNLTLANGNDVVTTGNGNSQVQVGNGSNAITVGNGNNQITTGSGINAIHVGTGNDTIINHGGTDSLYFVPGMSAGALSFSQSGNDLLITEGCGTTGSVRIVGGNSNPAAAISQFVMGNGNYTFKLDNGSYNLAAGNGVDTLYGGNGNDRVVLGNGNDLIQLGNGNDQITTGQGNSLIYFGNGTDAITSGGGNNFIQQTSTGCTSPSGNVTIAVGNGQNTIVAGNGNDSVSAGSGNNLIELGFGNDQIIVGGGANQIMLGDRNTSHASIATGDGRNWIEVGDGSDQISLGAGGNQVYLGAGVDAITAGNGNNLIDQYYEGSGSAATPNGQDTVTLGNGQNTVLLDDGQDQVTLGTGSNWVSLGNGADTVNAQDSAGQSNVVLLGSGKNSISLGNGNNQISTSDRSGGADTIAVGNGNNNINAGQGNDTVTAGNGNNAINAGNGNLVMTLGSGSNALALGNGTDSVALGNGNNTLSIGSGNDTLTIGNGNNNLVLGAGRKTVSLGAGVDTINTIGGSDNFKLSTGQYNFWNFGATDNVTLGAGSSTQLWFQRSGNSLVATVMDSSEKIIVNNWFVGGALNQMTASNGLTASAASINQLVQAMAAFAPPSAGQTSYTAAEQKALAPLLASSWH